MSSDETGLPPEVTHWLATTLIVVATGVLVGQPTAAIYQGTWGKAALYTIALSLWVGLLVPWHLRHLPRLGPPSPEGSR